MTLTRKPLVTEGNAFVKTTRSAERPKDHMEVTAMKRNKKRLAIVVLAICALAAGGAALTNSITGSPVTNGTTAGYGTINVNGATVTDVNYTLSADGTSITNVNFTFTGNLETDTLRLAFDNANLGLCAHTGITNGVIPSGAYSAPSTTVTCDVSETTTAATSLQVAVTNN